MSRINNGVRAFNRTLAGAGAGAFLGLSSAVFGVGGEARDAECTYKAVLHAYEIQPAVIEADPSACETDTARAVGYLASRDEVNFFKNKYENVGIMDIDWSDAVEGAQLEAQISGEVYSNAWRSRAIIFAGIGAVVMTTPYILRRFASTETA